MGAKVGRTGVLGKVPKNGSRSEKALRTSDVTGEFHGRPKNSHFSQ